MTIIMVTMTIPVGWRQASAYSRLKLSALLVGEIAAPASIIERMVMIVLLVSHILTMWKQSETNNSRPLVRFILTPHPDHTMLKTDGITLKQWEISLKISLGRLFNQRSDNRQMTIIKILQLWFWLLGPSRKSCSWKEEEEGQVRPCWSMPSIYNCHWSQSTRM